LYSEFLKRDQGQFFKIEVKEKNYDIVLAIFAKFLNSVPDSYLDPQYSG